MRFQISDFGKDFEISVKISKDFNEISRSEQCLGICHSSVVFTTQSAKDNDNANIDYSSQQDVSATWKLSQKNGLSRRELNLHNQLPSAVQLRPGSHA